MHVIMDGIKYKTKEECLMVGKAVYIVAGTDMKCIKDVPDL